ncbi:MAG: polysaccharide biosynthesis C-terminal domain-containing protein [Ignavibacteriales bacterium]|nr:polysaccharide biosynthesis C-terminal domain-containing protein [Ignavibacteriales bacterium]
MKNIITKIITYIALAYIIVSIFILYIFKYLIELIGNGGYTDSYLFVFLLIPALGFTALNYIGQSLIHLNNKTKTTGFISFIVTVISIVISYFATKFYGTFGTILGINFYLIASGLVLFYYGNKEFTVPIESKRIGVILISGIFLFIAFYALSLYSNLIFYSISTLLILCYIAAFYLSDFFHIEEKRIIDKGISTILNYAKLG